jgi:hypothetical protein
MEPLWNLFNPFVYGLDPQEHLLLKRAGFFHSYLKKEKNKISKSQLTEKIGCSVAFTT